MLQKKVFILIIGFTNKILVSIIGMSDLNLVIIQGK